MSTGKKIGLEHELLTLLAHSAPEVRGLTVQLVGKLAARGRYQPSVGDAVRELLGDTDERVQSAARASLQLMETARDAPVPLAPEERVIVNTGNYEELESYKATVIIYQGTVAFCKRFIDRFSRTTDQMVQAARSGKQNIVEGCKASGISAKSELKLVGVARASLEELLEDYRDFLRHRDLPIWEKGDEQAKHVRRLAYAENRTYETYRSHIEKDDAEIAANTLLCLTHQANYLLDKQLAALEAAFVDKGGFSERLYAARQHRRKRERE